MFKKWWLLQHVNGTEWFPIRVTTLLGYPLCTMFYRACGPFKTEQDALEELKVIYETV